MSELWLSNRYEVLAERLVETLGGPRRSLFEAEQVIVPSAALQRDLSLRIAERHGVCMQVEFSFLAQWLWRRIAARLPEVGEASPFSPGPLAWRIHRHLKTAAAGQGELARHERLARYLARADAAARFDLAQRLAALLEHTITYRSDWLAHWARGRAVPAEGPLPALWRADEAWQAALWRQLRAELGEQRLGDTHPAERYLQALAQDEAAGRPADASGAPVHVFCLPAIAPLYLAVLQRLAHHLDLRLYVLNPCREHWFDLVDARRLARLALQGRAGHAEIGHPLLSAWGTQTQDQLALLYDDEAPAWEDQHAFVPAEGDTLLARLQNAVLDATPLPPQGITLAPDDRSLELHVCHSLTRELEVLHDRLLDLFAEPAVPPGPATPGRPALRPDDVLVVLPDLDRAAPLVDAVFGTVPPERHIPFAITGRPRRAVNRCARALHDVLQLLTSPCPASAIVELLQQPPVARRFGLDEAALERVHDWLADAGIRWGLAAPPGANPGEPPPHRHSLDDGLQRLFLAHALPPAVAEPFAGTLPAGVVDGAEALWLGALWRYAEQLRTWQQELSIAHPPAGWLALLQRVLEGLLRPLGDELDELSELQDRLRLLAEQMAEGGVEEPVEPAVLQRALEDVLAEPPRGGVPTGRVTFAAMSSLRGLPFRVVCVLGLDDGAWPSVVRPLEFDLMARRPRRGDRQRRLDERNTFLDLLLSARERLHLSHTGRSARDNGVRPPSVLVSELLDGLLAALRTDEHHPTPQALRARLVVEHPLQPFSPRAHAADGDPRLLSYQREFAEALRAARDATAGRIARYAAAVEASAALPEDAGPDDEDDDRRPSGPAPRFFEAPLPPPEAAWREVDLPTLVRFFGAPCRFLLDQRLRIALPRPEEGVVDDEVYAGDYTGRVALATQVLPQALAGASPDALEALAAALLAQPDGDLGAAWRADELQRLRRHADAVRRCTAAPVLPPTEHCLQTGIDGHTWTLRTAFVELRPGGLVRHAYVDTRAVERLEAWLWHLALCAAAPAGVAPCTRWLARDGSFRLRPVAAPEAELRTLLALYARGLREPLHFYPRSAWAYAEAGGGSTGLAAALGRWEVDRRRPWGESGQPAHRLALRGVDQPLDADFEATAMAVFGPLIEHLENDTGDTGDAAAEALA